MKISNKSFTMELDNSNCSICFDDSVTVDKEAGKDTEQMKSLLYSQKIDETIPLYQFYVGVEGKEDAKIIRQTGLRYDVILVNPGTVAGELKKTSGHQHVGLYPEIYEVLHGTALFLLQKGSGKEIEHFAAVETQSGQKILIPPGYSHATVNIGEGPLVFSDLVADSCQNRYEDIQENHGMCYYILNQEGVVSFEKNKNYSEVPMVKKIVPINQTALGLDFTKPVYDLLIEKPELFNYLEAPEEAGSSIYYLANEIERMN